MVHTTGNLRYCSKHKHWFDVRYGCQECFLEQDKYRSTDNSKISLIKCPLCSKTSLAWFELANRYECMNIQCKQVLSKQEYATRIQKLERLQKEQTKDAESETGSKIEILKCPICLKVSVAWSESNNRYECLNLKCKNTFSKEGYETRIEEWNRLLTEEPKGKAWFGNSYFDPKKKKWKKGK